MSQAEKTHDQLTVFLEAVKAGGAVGLSDEAKIKQGIVLKVLFLLGWDTFDIEEVTPEYSVGGGRVDYALRVQSSPAVFIEVKSRAEDLERHQEQLLGYSFHQGVKLAILTNGATWWFYLPLQEGTWEQRKFYAIDVFEQEAADVACRFIDLVGNEAVRTSRALQNAEDLYRGQRKLRKLRETLPTAWNKIVDEPADLLIELINETAERLCGFRAEPELIAEFLRENRARLAIPPPARANPLASVRPARVTREPGHQLQSLRQKFHDLVLQAHPGTEWKDTSSYRGYWVAGRIFASCLHVKGHLTLFARIPYAEIRGRRDDITFDYAGTAEGLWHAGCAVVKVREPADLGYAVDVASQAHAWRLQKEAQTSSGAGKPSVGAPREPSASETPPGLRLLHAILYSPFRRPDGPNTTTLATLASEEPTVELPQLGLGVVYQGGARVLLFMPTRLQKHVLRNSEFAGYAPGRLRKLILSMPGYTGHSWKRMGGVQRRWETLVLPAEIQGPPPASELASKPGGTSSATE